MSTDNLPVKATANVKLTRALLNEAENLNEMLNIPALQDRWVSTYKGITGKNDGEMRFEAEKILFTQALAANTKFNDCDRFTVYAAFIEHAISGLTLRDGLAYIIPYGKKAQWQPGWKGRLEQISEIPNVVHVSEPQVVYDCDVFEYELGMKTTIHKHVPVEPRPEGAKITHVYLVIHFTHGLEVYMMTASQVLNIRDTYSASYKQYVKDLEKPQNKNKKWGDKLTIKYQKDGQWKEYESEDVPMWVGNPEQAFKKTLIKRAWNSIPNKLAKHKALDDKMAAFFRENQVDPVDPEETPINHASYQDVTNILNDNLDSDNVDTDTGEITPHEVVDEQGNVITDVIVETEAQEQARVAAEKKAAKAAKKAEKVEQPKPDANAALTPSENFNNTEDEDEIPDSF